MTSIDASEVTTLGRTLTASTALVPALAKAIVAKAGLNVKNDARQRISGLRHASGYPYSIKYETKGLEVEIGPEVGGRQWGLGDILEYGTAKNPPHPHLMPAAQAELPKFEHYLAEVVVKALP